LIEYGLNTKRFNLAYYESYFQKYSFLGFEKIIQKTIGSLPKSLKDKFFTNPFTGEFIAVAKK
jgi:hypothetical protein